MLAESTHIRQTTSLSSLKSAVHSSRSTISKMANINPYQVSFSLFDKYAGVRSPTREEREEINGVFSGAISEIKVEAPYLLLSFTILPAEPWPTFFADLPVNFIESRLDDKDHVFSPGEVTKGVQNIAIPAGEAPNSVPAQRRRL